MLITQTPLRISFFGGGTDFAEFFRQEGGCVISSAIDKYIYVIVKRRFDRKIRVGYTQTELVEKIDDLQHELVREALRLTGVKSQVEIGTMGDIPSSGSGLGSSSSVTVGVLNALSTWLNMPQTQEQLARQACEIEIETLRKPIGKQDQYIAAYGGLRFIQFLPDDNVVLDDIKISEEERRRFNNHLMLFYTNAPRQSTSILTEQRENIRNRMRELGEIKSMVHHGKSLLESGDFDAFGSLLDEGWKMKKRLASKVSNATIDEIYNTAKKSGALGGKITGAGGGGFLLLFCPTERQYAVRDALRELQELPFNLERDGSKIIFNYRRYL